MKKSWLVILSVVAVLVAGMMGCSKKKIVSLEPSDFGTATTVGTSTLTVTLTPAGTSTFTNTYTLTPTHTITPTETPYAGSPTYTLTITMTTPPTGTFTATETPAASPTITNTVFVAPAGWIDDCEDGDNTNDYSGARLGGYWITYDDTANSGTSYVWPMSDTWALKKGLAPQQFMMSSITISAGSPANLSSFAARMTGYVTTNTSTIPPGETTAGYVYGFIGMGCQFNPNAGESGGCQKTDLSAFSGIRFMVRGDGDMYSVKLPLTYTTLCDTGSSPTEFNDYKFDFIAPTEWTLMQIAFTQFTQEGWGKAVSLTYTVSNASQIQFQTRNQTAGHLYPNIVDFWIDDIEVY
ncbi:MAG: CIA30 family protein [Spirochaetia bacterium]|nr:CIA30 family protein [Spirochaetia bacterium]